MGTVTVEEKEQFTTIKERLRVLLEHQITNFRFCFPFGRPEGALKSTLSLLERVRKSASNPWTFKMFISSLKVLMKDVATPVPQNEVRGVIKKCLENAALVNYERLSEEARIEGKHKAAPKGITKLAPFVFSRHEEQAGGDGWRGDRGSGQEA